MKPRIPRAPLSGALVVLAVACGGPDRPAENPLQGPTGGQSSTDIPVLPSPTPAPGTEPVPAPGGPDTVPGSDAPSTTMLDVRSPVIATTLYSDVDVYGKAQAGSGIGGAAGGMPGIGGLPGLGGVGGRGR